MENIPLDSLIIPDKITHALFEYRQIGHVNFNSLFLKDLGGKAEFGFLSTALDSNHQRFYEHPLNLSLSKLVRRIRALL